MMKGKSARVAVSMGMPGLVYRFAMDEGALKALERGILGISGFHPMHHSIIGGAGNLKDDDFRSWQTYFYRIGTEGV
jgi:putative NADPH-quinone reductase